MNPEDEYQERAEKFIELLDRDDWLWTEVHKLIDRSPEDSAVKEAAKGWDLAAVHEFHQIYHDRAVEVATKVFERAKLALLA